MAAPSILTNVGSRIPLEAAMRDGTHRHRMVTLRLSGSQPRPQPAHRPCDVLICRREREPEKSLSDFAKVAAGTERDVARPVRPLVD
mgnify:CR=1 FL=1